MKSALRSALASGLPIVILAACHDATSETPPVTVRRLAVAAAPGTTDTIQSEPIQALVVRLETSTGELATGVTVRFQTATPTGVDPSVGMNVRGVDQTQWQPLAVTETDSRGQVAAQVKFGTKTGTGFVIVQVPEFGMADTVGFTIQPGHAAGIEISPKDTTLHTGRAFQYHGAVIDAFRNPRSDPVTFTATSQPTGLVTVDQTGQVTTTGVGRLEVVVAAGAVKDTAHATVVPDGQFLARTEFNGIAVFDLDGTKIQDIGATALAFDGEAAWAPDASEVVLGASGPNLLTFLGVAGPTTLVSWDPSTGLANGYWPAYSPDGQYIYVSNVGSPDGIWRVRRDGSGVESVAAGLYYRPTVSPDGGAVAFHTLGADFSTVVVRIIGIGTGQIGSDVPGRFPEWGPGTSGIAFMDNATNRIELMAGDGSGIRFLTVANHAFADAQLAWSPDGAWILARGPAQLELVEVATGRILPLPWSFSLTNPAWRPDGFSNPLDRHANRGSVAVRRR